MIKMFFLILHVELMWFSGDNIVFSNIYKFNKVNKIIVISGIADFYLSKYFKMTYPDLLYFNSDFLSV